MNKRELNSAKRFPHSRARQLVLERGMDAIARILLTMLGHLEPTDDQQVEAVRAVQLIMEVLDASS